MDDFEIIKTLSYNEAQELREQYLKTASFFKKRKPELAQKYNALAIACLKRMKDRISNLRCRPEGYQP